MEGPELGLLYNLKCGGIEIGEGGKKLKRS
jgi:hypothetical protein